MALLAIFLTQIIAFLVIDFLSTFSYAFHPMGEKCDVLLGYSL
jgi:hypothetical protein